MAFESSPDSTAPAATESEQHAHKSAFHLFRPACILFVKGSAACARPGVGFCRAGGGRRARCNRPDPASSACADTPRGAGQGVAGVGHRQPAAAEVHRAAADADLERDTEDACAMEGAGQCPCRRRHARAAVNAPETKEAFDEIARFFDKHLGK